LPTTYPTAPDGIPEIPVLNISWFLGKAPLPSAVVHQDAVALAFRIQDLQRERPSNAWIHAVDIAVNDLSIPLNELQMHDDAVAICTLRISLWRAIAGRYPSPTASRRLADALMKLAVVVANMGEHTRTYVATAEAIQILQPLVDVGLQEPNVRLKMQDIELLARGMILQAGNDPDPIRALQLAVDAGKILERALGLEDLSETDISVSALSPGDWAVISSSGTVIVSDDTHFTYASSLLRIAQIQLTHRQSVASNKYAKTGLAILNHLLAKYPGSDKIQDEITRALTHLSGMSRDDPHAEHRR
jgi:hypothetical protein